MPSANTAVHELLPPSVLAGIDDYQLLARIVVEGFLAGMHRGVYHGAGSEFTQYRAYTPGDDIKSLDWKVYGRSDRYHVKLYQEDTNFDCLILLDASASMGYRGAGSPCGKLRHAAMAAACLAYMAARQGDRPSVLVYGGGARCLVPPSSRSGHLRRVMAALAGAKASGTADHQEALALIGGSPPRRRGMIVMLSDFIDVEDAHETFKPLRASRDESLVCQVLDRDELEFPFRGACKFIDAEDGASRYLDPDRVRVRYQERVTAHCAELARSCRGSRVDYLRLLSDEPLGLALAAYLGKRRSVYGC